MFYIPADLNVSLDSASWTGRRWFSVAALLSAWRGLWTLHVSSMGVGGRVAGHETPCPHWNMRAGDPRSPFPVSTLSASCSVISVLLKHLMKASPQINVCASLFFMRLKWGTILPSPSFILFLLHSSVCFWDATREVTVSGLYYGSIKSGLGRLRGQWLCLFI